MNKDIKAGADIHAGDGGYSIGTQEEYDKFVKGRNQSLGKTRIKELALECYNPYSNFDHEKFAELIVRECAQTLRDNTPVLDEYESEEDWDRGYGQAMKDCVHHIREHFGVEE